MPDEPRHDARDTARPTATAYPLTLEDVSRLFDEAGLPRNVRTLQRYCAAGRLDCIKEETATGLAYFVDPVSVERAIKQLAQSAGSACLNRFPRTISGVLPVLSGCVLPRVGCDGGRA